MWNRAGELELLDAVFAFRRTNAMRCVARHTRTADFPERRAGFFDIFCLGSGGELHRSSLAIFRQLHCIISVTLLPEPDHVLVSGRDFFCVPTASGPVFFSILRSAWTDAFVVFIHSSMGPLSCAISAIPCKPKRAKPI